MRSLLKIVSASSLLLLAISCGRAVDETTTENDSQVMSLVSYPCQEYGVNLGESRYHCVAYQTGESVTNVLFQLDGFDQAQIDKLKEAINIGAAAYSAYYTDLALNANSDPAIFQCIMRRADKEMDPLNSKISVHLKEPKQKIQWAFGTLRTGFTFHQQSATPIVITSYNEPRDGNVAPLAHATIGTDALASNIRLDFAVNTASLSKPDTYSYKVGSTTYMIDFSAKTFAGALIHEMLHRKGYTHAVAGHSVGPLVYEFGNCISNANFGLTLTSIDLPAVD